MRSTAARPTDASRRLGNGRWYTGMKLRSYQQADIERLRSVFAAGARSVLYQAPTGSGKTVLFATLVQAAAARGKRVAILGHRQEIVDQISIALEALGVAHGIIAAGQPETPAAYVQIASVHTLARRLNRLSNIDLIVADEAHHAAADTWLHILAQAPNAKLLGTTATPQRLDGKGLSDIFAELVVGPSVQDLIDEKWLAPATCFAPARSVDLRGVKTRMGDFATDQLGEIMGRGIVIDSAVNEYTRLCNGLPAIAFCVNIEHSRKVAERLTAHGYRAAHIDGDTSKHERRALIQALGNGELQILTNCGLISEGLDVPSVHAAILLRPTKSLALYLQQVGRALRPAANKRRALILDHAGNVFRFGPPETPHSWSLSGHARNGHGAAPVKRCAECGAIVGLSAWSCPECGAALRRPAPEIDISLERTDHLRLMTFRQAMRWAGRDEQKLRLVAEARGYKPGWIWHRLQEMRGNCMLREERHVGQRSVRQKLGHLWDST